MFYYTTIYIYVKCYQLPAIIYKPFIREISKGQKLNQNSPSLTVDTSCLQQVQNDFLKNGFIQKEHGQLIFA